MRASSDCAHVKVTKGRSSLFTGRYGARNGISVLGRGSRDIFRICKRCDDTLLRLKCRITKSHQLGYYFDFTRQITIRRPPRTKAHGTGGCLFSFRAKNHLREGGKLPKTLPRKYRLDFGTVEKIWPYDVLFAVDIWFILIQ